MRCFYCVYKTDSTPKIMHSRPSSQLANSNFHNSWYLISRYSWYLVLDTEGFVVKNGLRGSPGLWALSRTDWKIMDIEIADGADSLPQAPSVGTNKRQGWSSLSIPLTSSPHSYQPLQHVPYLIHTQGRGEVILVAGAVTPWAQPVQGRGEHSAGNGTP